MLGKIEFEYIYEYNKSFLHNAYKQFPLCFVMQRQGAWIDVYLIEERNLSITPTKKKVTLDQKLLEHMNSLGIGFNSWVPSVDSIFFNKTNVILHSGVTTYKETKAVTDSLARKLPFAPQAGYNPCLSVGFLTATSDKKLILQRRPEGVHCERTFIHEPCGYMSSGYIDPRPENLVDEELIKNPGLYSLNMQLNRRRKEIAGTFNMPVDSVSYDPQQDFLGAGWRTVEMYLSTTGRINASEEELRKSRNEMIKKLEMEGKQKEADNERIVEHCFVPFEDLKSLIFSQGKMSSINPVGYIPKNFTDLPLLDETTSGLIFGYNKITQEKLDVRETTDRLNHDGMSIIIYNNAPGMKYGFPTKF